MRDARSCEMGWSDGGSHGLARMDTDFGFEQAEGSPWRDDGGNRETVTELSNPPRRNPLALRFLCYLLLDLVYRQFHSCSFASHSRFSSYHPPLSLALGRGGWSSLVSRPARAGFAGNG